MRVYADSPGKAIRVGGADSTAIFTGTRWVILVKLPAALFAGDQRKLRRRGTADAFDLAGDLHARIGVYGNLHAQSRADVPEFGLFIIGGYPDVFMVEHGKIA